MTQVYRTPSVDTEPALGTHHAVKQTWHNGRGFVMMSRHYSPSQLFSARYEIVLTVFGRQTRQFIVTCGWVKFSESASFYTNPTYSYLRDSRMIILK